MRGRTAHRSGIAHPSPRLTYGGRGGEKGGKNFGVLPLPGAGREAAVSYSVAKARKKYIKGQETRIYCLLKVQSTSI